MRAEPLRQVTRVSAYAVCVEDGRILLVRIAPGYTSRYDGWWTLPGGGLDHGEDPRAGALRELEEETGLVGELGDVLDVYSNHTTFTEKASGEERDYHGIGILFQCRIVGGELRNEVGGSSDECRWFTADDLPRDRLVDIAEIAVRRSGIADASV